jgi:MFS transporter, DHA1 family, multidrug resistance protein
MKLIVSQRLSNSAASHRGLAMLLAAVSALGPFSIDAYLPSIPEIGRTFGVSALSVQQTLTAYMAPFAFMTLWHGAISDALGRRRVTLAALALFALASVGCTLAWSLESLIAFRVLQGMTAGAGMVIGRAIVRDVLDGAEAQRLMSHVSVMFALAPAVAPVLGGWLHVWFGWRAVFAFLVLFTVVLWIWCWRSLPETLSAGARQPLAPTFLLRSYAHVLSTPTFLAACATITLAGGGLFIYVMSAPVFLLQHLHVSETGFLWLFGPATTGIMAGAWLSGRAAGRISRLKTISLGFALMALAASGNVAFHLVRPAALPWSVVPLFFFVTGMSLSMPSATLVALDLFPAQRGLAASCHAFVQTCGNSATTAFVAPLVWTTPLRMAEGQAGFVMLGAAALLVYSRLISSRTDAAARAPGS